MNNRILKFAIAFYILQTFLIQHNNCNATVLVKIHDRKANGVVINLKDSLTNYNSQKNVQEKSISFLTFNAGLLRIKLLGITILENPPYIEERLKELPKQLKKIDADIIALQEVWAEKHKKYLIDSLKDTYPFYAYFSEKSFNKHQNGEIFFSKFPIDESCYNEFNNTSIDEKHFVSQGILSIKFTTKQFGEISCFDTHTTAGGALKHPEARKTDDIRDLQIRQMLELSKNSNGITVLMGDLNAGPGVSEQNYRSILQAGYDDTYLVGNSNTEDCVKCTWDPRNPLNSDGPHKTSPPQRIDHIFIPEKILEKFVITDAKVVFEDFSVKVENIKLITLSDHYGVFIKITCK